MLVVTSHMYKCTSCCMQLPPANEPSVFFGALTKSFESVKQDASNVIDEAKRKAEKAAPAVSAGKAAANSGWFTKKE